MRTKRVGRLKSCASLNFNNGIWTPVSWDNVANTGTLVRPGNGVVQKTAGANPGWDNVTYSNTQFSTFPVQLRVKLSALVVGSFGFAAAAGNQLANPGDEFSEKWAAGNYDPGTSHLSHIEDPAGYITTGVDFDPTLYVYIKVSAAGVVTLWKDSTSLFTYIGSAASNTLIPFACQYNSIGTSWITEAAYLIG